MFVSMLTVICIIQYLCWNALSKEILIFEDNFDSFDLSTWKHDITMSGGGSFEFQIYTNNRTNSYTEDGILYLQPNLTSEIIGEDKVLGTTPFQYDIWGLTYASQCTSNAFYGCLKTSDASQGYVINPITSAKVTTADSFYFTYGRVEVRAKMPRGDWIWPALWLNSKFEPYGGWPASGEIDIAESKGNLRNYTGGGTHTVRSSLQWGPFYSGNRFELTSVTKELSKNERTYAQDFHIFGMEWSEKGILTYVDSPDNEIMRVKFDEPMWVRGGFDKESYKYSNPWKESKTIAAPFDQPFFLVFNVAVGTIFGYFPDAPNKPWNIDDKNAFQKFWNAKSEWYSTWKIKDSAMKISSVRVWQDENRIDYECTSIDRCPLKKARMREQERVSIVKNSSNRQNSENIGIESCSDGKFAKLNQKVFFATAVNVALAVTVFALMILFMKHIGRQDEVSRMYRNLVHHHDTEGIEMKNRSG